MSRSLAPYDLVCLSHLRWDFVYQRPHHLLSRCAQTHRVYFVEEPILDAGPARLEVSPRGANLWVAVPHLPEGLTAEEAACAQRDLLDGLLAEHHVHDYVLWYYTPMALQIAGHLQPLATIYDCMDELSAFAGAHPTLPALEAELFAQADLVFTGGQSLFEAKRGQHPQVYLFPSAVDRPHFATAREGLPDPADQASIPHPRLGFYGVIDERMDLDLLVHVAEAHPEWQLILVGPIAKIDPTALPQRENIHYLGAKEYDDLPAYLTGWDAALLPFADNASTRFISPTKTPEYLAGGRPVVSTALRDVIAPYGESGLVQIAATPEAFVAAVERVLGGETPSLTAVDAMLETMSWDRTWQRMQRLIDAVVDARRSGDALAHHNGHADTSGAAERVLQREVVSNAPNTSHANGHSRTSFDYVIVGAGFAGSVLAERLARVADKRVLLLDKRPHIGGNAYDHYDDAGLLVHKYGPHIFHTNAATVFDYLSQFTAWRPYQHRVRALVDGQLVPLPINLDTINTLYGLHLSSFQLEEFFAARAEPIAEVRTAEDVVVSAVGRELYEKFFRGYTRKQWGLDPSELDAAVTARVPTRTSRDDRYFADTYQAMPLHGYTRLFEKMLDHPNIKILLNADYQEVRDLLPAREVIYTGPIDEYFDYRFGKLPYRSLEFRFETHDVATFQPAPVVNYPNDYAYTRCTEFKYLTGQEHPKTTVVYEYPRAEGDPYYPIPRAENAALYEQYKALAAQTPGVRFVGRLATYKYYNMDQVVAQALAEFQRIMGTKPAPAARNGARPTAKAAQR